MSDREFIAWSIAIRDRDNNCACLGLDFATERRVAFWQTAEEAAAVDVQVERSRL